MVEIVQCITETHIADLRALLTEYFEWSQTFNDSDMDNIPTFEAFKREFDNLPGKYAPEHGGGFYLAYDGNQLAGCIALRKKDDHTCELKRMYVYPDYRSKQIGWDLLQYLLSKAHDFGYNKIALDSHKSMTKAHELYQSVGFETVSAPDDFPQNLKPIVVFMELSL